MNETGGQVSNSFPPCARVLKPAEFQNAFKKGKRFSTDHLDVVVAPAAEFKSAHRHIPAPLTARLGLAVAAKAYSRAVDRNRIKRVARNSFRLVREQLAVVDIVISIRKPRPQPGQKKNKNVQPVKGAPKVQKDLSWLNSELNQVWKRLSA